MSRKNRVIMGCFIAASFTATPSAESCADFGKPETHFDGVNEFGFVSYWEQLGGIRLSDGSVLPIIIGFRSDWDTYPSSSHLGRGWLFGLLDARFVQKSENAFDMISIDGYTVPFGRDPKTPTILNGARGWKAELKGDVVSVWAECGWKLQFTKGRISAVTSPKNANVLFRRGPDGQVTDLSEGATALLKVQSDFEGRINGFSLADGKKFGISTIERPVIQYVAGLNVISATQPSLEKVTLPDGTTWNYGYASDANLLPTLSITKPGQSARKITWDPATKLIRSDGHWNYDIQPALISGANAAIGRTERTTGQREFWHYDTTKGEEFQIGATGVKTVKRWFTSGVLNGKLRVISENGTIRQKCSYDDKGRLVSNHVIGSSTEHFEYGETGRLVRKIENDKTYMYDSQGRLLKVSDKQREIVRCSYDSETGLLNGVWSLGKRIF